MKRRKVLALLMSAVMTFTSVAPETALMVHAEDDVVIEEVSEEGETASEIGDDSSDEHDDVTTTEEAVYGNEAEEAAEDTASQNEAEDAGETETVSDNVAVSENAAEETDTVSENKAVSENEAEEIILSVLPYGLKGMPADYVMSEQERAIKDDAAAHDLAGGVAVFTEGIDYEPATVYFLADDEEYAETVADAYNAGLKSFDGYVATLDLSNSGMTVAEAVAIGADPAYNMPAVDADYIITVGTGYEGWTDDEINGYSFWGRKPEETGWEDIVGKMGNRDPRLNPSDKNYQWWHDVVGSYAAWGVMGYDFSASGIKVAVIDSGVNSSHEEFSGHLSIVNGADANGHGSNVAGIIGASANNGKGGAGVAPGIQLIGYNVSNTSGVIDSSKIASSIKAAADAGASIINMSLGGPGYNSNYVSAINYAYGKDVTMIAAAGNEAANTVSYPACYDHVISVAATQPDGTLTTFSNYGDEFVDIAAPGADMYSCNKGSAGSYVKMQGTSQAAPVVTGVCAVYMSICGKVKPDQMLRILKDGATKTSAKGDGAGIVNLSRMLKADTTGPKISFKDANGKDVVIEGGKTGSATVLADAQLTISSENFNANANSNEKTTIFFTINGKAPSFNGWGYTNPDTYISWDGKLAISEWSLGK